ncbi:hypothetical protein [Aeromonas phage AerS_266]|nr:hypothetical protein [Aeromonas phage AerS_266]
MFNIKNIEIVQSPMVTVWKETLKDNNVFSPEHQGQSEHTGTFDGIKYQFSVSHTLGSLFYAGVVGNTPFIIQAPRNQTVQMYIGNEVTDSISSEREKQIKDGISQAFSKSVGGDEETPHNLYKYANPHSENQIKELFNMLFVVEKIEQAFKYVNSKLKDFSKFKQSVRYQLAGAVTRIVGSGKISELDKVFTDNTGMDLNTIVMERDKTIIPLEFGSIVVEKDGPVQIKFSVLSKDNETVLHETTLQVSVAFIVTPENKYIKEHFETALSFYFDHFNINN